MLKSVLDNFFAGSPTKAVAALLDVVGVVDDVFGGYSGGRTEPQSSDCGILCALSSTKPTQQRALIPKSIYTN